MKPGAIVAIAAVLLLAVCAVGTLFVARKLREEFQSVERLSSEEYPPEPGLAFESDVWKAHPEHGTSDTVRRQMVGSLIRDYLTTKMNVKTVQDLIGRPSKIDKPGAYSYWLGKNLNVAKSVHVYPVSREDIGDRKLDHILDIAFDKHGMLVTAWHDPTDPSLHEPDKY